MKQIIHTGKAPKAIGPYSQAVKAGNTLYISGQVPINPDTGKIVEGGIKEQTEQVMQNIDNLEKKKQLSFENKNIYEKPKQLIAIGKTYLWLKYFII